MIARTVRHAEGAVAARPSTAADPVAAAADVWDSESSSPQMEQIGFVTYPIDRPILLWAIRIGQTCS